MSRRLGRARDLSRLGQEITYTSSLCGFCVNEDDMVEWTARYVTMGCFARCLVPVVLSDFRSKLVRMGIDGSKYGAYLCFDLYERKEGRCCRCPRLSER